MMCSIWTTGPCSPVTGSYLQVTITLSLDQLCEVLDQQVWDQLSQIQVVAILDTSTLVLARGE